MKKVFIAGHKGMVGSSIYKKLVKKNYKLIIADRNQLDLTKSDHVENFFQSNKPDYVINCAAKVGGIKANYNFPAKFISENSAIQLNIVKSSFLYGVRRMINIGSSCIYPKNSKIPIKENSLLTGKLEITNEAYAISKILGLKLCQYYNKEYGTDYRSLMPCNLYGPNDRYDYEDSHVIPALIMKIHNAMKKNSKYVELWGTGKPKREFLYVDDFADACIKVLRMSKIKFMNMINDNSHINVGTQSEISIKNLSKLIARVIGYKGKIKFNGELDGVYRKLIDSKKIRKSQWRNYIKLEKGIFLSYQDFISRYEK